MEATPEMLVGTDAPGSATARILHSALLLALLAPWLGMALGLTLMGLLAIGPRRAQFPELWICLPAGVALQLMLALLLHSHFWRVPRARVSEFAFDGVKLRFRTPRHGEVAIPADDVVRIEERRGRRGRGLRGWSLVCRDLGVIHLHATTTNANELIDRLKARPPISD